MLHKVGNYGLARETTRLPRPPFSPLPELPVAPGKSRLFFSLPRCNSPFSEDCHCCGLVSVSRAAGTTLHLPNGACLPFCPRKRPSAHDDGMTRARCHLADRHPRSEATWSPQRGAKHSAHSRFCQSPGSWWASATRTTWRTRRERKSTVHQSTSLRVWTSGRWMLALAVGLCFCLICFKTFDLLR